MSVSSVLFPFCLEEEKFISTILFDYTTTLGKPDPESFWSDDLEDAMVDSQKGLAKPA
jgi:hypothetical protein